MVANVHVDCSYAMLETIDFHLFRSRPLKDYAIEVCEDGSMKFTPAYIEQYCSLCFKFVRGDGNKYKLRLLVILLIVTIIIFIVIFFFAFSKHHHIEQIKHYTLL